MLMHELSFGDYVALGFVLMTVAAAVSAVWNWFTGRRPDRDERIRIAALEMAIESHGLTPGEEHDACFPARARVFERYLRTGHHKAEERAGVRP